LQAILLVRVILRVLEVSKNFENENEDEDEEESILPQIVFVAPILMASPP
jgi:hypothetical protein